jgi:RNA polymerase sigma-70 factor (ECF subfamily)
LKRDGTSCAPRSDLHFERDTSPRRHFEDAVDQRGLVERARGGDHDAFALLTGVSIARLDAAARLILRDPDLARDAVQDGFVRAWKGLPTLRDPDHWDAWLRTLVVRSCFDILRHRRRRPLEIELTASHDRAVGDIACQVADRDLLDAALRRLSAGQRAVIVLHYYLGLPLPEVAAALGIPTGTAKSRLHRSLALMRAAVDAQNAAVDPLAGGQLA